MKAEDNPFPYITLVEGAAPAAPSAGRQKEFIDSADHKVKRINSAGTVTTIEGTGGGGGAAVILRDDLAGASPTSTTVNAYTAISGLTFSYTPTVNGVLMLNSRCRAKITDAGGNLYMRAKISPAPASGSQYIGASNESPGAGKLKTFNFTGNWGLTASTAYTVTLEFYQASSSSTFTADGGTSDDTELTGVFLPT